MSERVMTVIEPIVSAAEVYSIDEAFVELTSMPGNLPHERQLASLKSSVCKIGLNSELAGFHRPITVSVMPSLTRTAKHA